MEQRLLNVEMIDLTSDENSVSLWFQTKTNHFVLMLNAKVIKATKTWSPIETKLNGIKNLKEI